ncbi:RNA cytidine acetyltransferase-like [Pseudophryne corroboree]|uniref:RNA cytidine acetyltransferase-like n=1 Tax=Pseudophryne corroboree TaxID=495146 RepID=UPI003081C030
MLTTKKEMVMEPTSKSLNEDLEEAAKEFQQKHKEEVEKLKGIDLSQYVIRGEDDEWNEVLKNTGQNASIVSVKSDKKRKLEKPERNGFKLQKKLKKSKDKKQKFRK